MRHETLRQRLGHGLRVVAILLLLAGCARFPEVAVPPIKECGVRMLVAPADVNDPRGRLIVQPIPRCR
jgi:hypothetical protein